MGERGKTPTTPPHIDANIHAAVPKNPPKRVFLGFQFSEIANMSSVTPETPTHLRVNQGRMEVAVPLHDLVVREILPGLGIDPASYWSHLEGVLSELAPKNNILLLKRYKLQAEIDTWHQSRCDAPHDHAQYRKFLEKLAICCPKAPTSKFHPRKSMRKSPALPGHSSWCR